MKQRYLLALLLMLLSSLSACAPGHLGGNVIAFLRDGHLWTADPNGANAVEVVAQDPPVVGYSWSPTHQILAFRTLDVDFAKTAAAQHLMRQPITGIIQDAPSTENTVGVDGGSPIPIAFSDPTISSSNAIWNAAGTRLLYRQSSNTLSAQWFISQDDQPGGIALKSFPFSYTIPSFSPDSQLLIGNDDRGIFTTTIFGSNSHYIMNYNPSFDHSLSASLNRILWRPAHQDHSFLYAAVDSSQSVRLILGTINGQSKTLATCACTQFAWSPDGNSLLFATDVGYTILNLQNSTFWRIVPENGSIPYWSPDSQFLLLEGTHTIQLLSLANHHQYTLFSNKQVHISSSLSSDILRQPLVNSPWAANSRHFLFLANKQFSWAHLSQGLYNATIDENGHLQGSPLLIDAGNDSQAGWTYQDTGTSWLP